MYIVVDNQTGEIKAQTETMEKALSIAQVMEDLHAYFDRHTFEVEIA